LIDAHEFGKLYENDQLNLQMVHGRAFPHYSESMPNFLPTYKFDPGTDTYDTSEKARIPAWCDRILTKGDNLRQLHYDSAPLKFSDHRPVWGLFQCQINVIDQVTKDRISEDLYVKRRAAVQGNSSSAKEFETDEESLIGYESIEPGLPPASSDKRKWWLDNGMPARSAVRPPPNSSNTDASGNPFTPASESDWVQVEKPWPTPKPPALPSRTRTFEQEQNHQPKDSNPQSRLRKVNPDAAVAPAGPPQPPPASHTMKQTLRKPAPPKPAPKPSTLRSPSSNSNRSSASYAGGPPPLPAPRRAAQNASPAPSDISSRTPMQPPPPRRSGSTAASSVRSTATPPPMPPPARRGTQLSHAEPAPGLPPRRTNTGATAASSNRGSLMDDDGSEGHEMGTWRPLKPL
jgi:hypothetical protein